MLTCIASKEVLTPQRDQPHWWENNKEVTEEFKIIFLLLSFKKVKLVHKTVETVVFE